MPWIMTCFDWNLILVQKQLLFGHFSLCQRWKIHVCYTNGLKMDSEMRTTIIKITQMTQTCFEMGTRLLG